MPIPVTLSDVINAGIKSAMDELHTAGPGRVETYDPVTQTANIRPLWKRRLYDINGNSIYEDLPVIPNVPMKWPRAGGYVLTFPVLPGDFVTLVFNEISTGEIYTDGQISEPVDARRHSLGYPVAIPGGFPDSRPLSPTDAAYRTAGMVLGLDGAPQQMHITPAGIQLGATAVDFVALTSLVMANLAAIKASFDAHIHPTGVGPSGVPAAPMTAPTSVASVMTKSL